MDFYTCNLFTLVTDCIDAKQVAPEDGDGSILTGSILQSKLPGWQHQKRIREKALVL